MRSIWLLAGVLVLGCSDDEEIRRCRLSSECELPQQCIDNRCLLECRVDTDCDDFDGHQCVENVCHDPNMVCQTDRDCRPFNMLCSPVTRRCTNPQNLVPCNPTRPCAQGFVCSHNLCFPNEGGGRPGLDGGIPVIDASRGIPIIDAQTMTPRRDAAPRPRDAARPPPRDAAPPQRDMMPPIGGAGRYGDPCQCSSDCGSGFCILNPYNQFAGQCTAQCRGGAGCPDRDVCMLAEVPSVRDGCQPPPHGLPAGSQVEICVPNETGQACDPNAGCPLGGLCIQPVNPLPGQIDIAYACGTTCRGNGECPSGFGCTQVQTPQGVVNACGANATINLCPNGSNDMCGGVCRGVANEADVAHCISSDGMSGGFCSCSCNRAQDCPQGFACEAGLPSGDNARPGICVPIAGYTCPGGDLNLCPSFTCIANPLGDGIDRCSSTCRNVEDCPTGFGCLPAGGTSICIPQ